ncbi:pyrimidine 5'-nucleotidase [Sphingomonas canadensis]|uniref:Pyrimidine 5'-nucleotidase n=1 Tax=Sphingomonas canadensis TaxID=1219257 RepID=A0ABW3H3C6_9SPHN|nr:pyrimidine 5'-nucleotidase [Sphingomonas canadensis]MCW3835270.1 pyrimidine 5'-nucleotidase [Sphingomonas canadensis]
MRADLAHVRNWIFDLDNTLYPARVSLFPQIDVRMREYIMRLTGADADEAHRIQKDYYFGHGTTLAGLMANHGIDPHEYLDFVHDVDLDVLEHDAALVSAIARLPGRKLVFTNGDAPYAARVLDRIGLGGTFEAVHDIHATGYRPKPDPHAYLGLCEAYAVAPAESLFVEDLARNLRPAKAIGMTTVWVDNGSEQPPECVDRSFVDHITNDLGRWLEEILEETA